MTTSPSRRSWPVLLAVGVTVLLWASAFIVIRAVGPFYQAGPMALLRLVVGAAALGVVVLRRGVRWPPRRAWPWVIAWGVAWFAGYNLALNTAEHRVDAGTSAMIVNLAPLLIVIFAGLFLGEGFPRRLLIGAPVSFLGVVLIGLAAGPGGHRDVVGLLLSLLAAVLYAGCALLQKRLLTTVDSATMTWLGVVAGAVVLLPFTPQTVHDLHTAPLSATLWVVFLGIFPTAIAFSTWAYVLARASVGTTSATTYLVPALTILLSWLALGEVPTPVKLLGGVLCLVGVVITHGRRRKPPVTPAEASLSTGRLPK